MHGPNINQSFEKKLNNNLQENNVEFMNIGSCSLHKVNNAFHKGLSRLKIDLDQFACDIYPFFKLLSSRREDYASLEGVTEVRAYAIKHRQGGFHSKKFMFVLFNSRTTYFNISKKISRKIKETICYQRSTLPCFAFVSFIAQDFEAFLVIFQLTFYTKELQTL